MTHIGKIELTSCGVLLTQYQYICNLNTALLLVKPRMFSMLLARINETLIVGHLHDDVILLL